MDRQELINYANSTSIFHTLDLSRVSSVLLTQVIQLESARIMNVHSVGDELMRIEKDLSHKVGSFKHNPLKGLHKAHFFNSSFILGNINAEFGLERGGNKSLDKLIREAFERNTSGYVDDDMAMFLAHNLTLMALEKRAKENRLSGEWIIFQIFNNKKYYLSIASHKESDHDIYNRIKLAYQIDFPFLDITQNSPETK